MTLSFPPNQISPSPTSNASGAVLREYTSPTCKLQISAKASALEKWTRKPTLKNQRFLLSFEDPRLSEDQWVNLRGDRLKLAALTEAVTTYVQCFLSQSRSVAQSYSQTDLTEPSVAEIPTSTQGISIQPKGLLAHTLKLGAIATEVTGESLTLTSTQLADLASVLDEHSTATLDLPVLNRDTAWMRSPMAWGKIAAFSLLSVGITANVINQFSPKQAPPQIASQASSSDQRLTPPQLPPTTPSPSTAIASSKLPTTPIPSAGSNTPPIAADSPPAATTPQESTKTDSSQKDNVQTAAPQASTQKNVESTKTEQNQEPSQRRQNVGPPPGAKVQSAPVAAKPQTQDLVKPNPSNETSKSADPEPPDLAPQVKAIRDKIPQQWKPPEKFSADLKYTLEIAPNGTILTKSLDGQSIPEAQLELSVGSTVAPPLAPNSTPYKVQIIFLPDGKISVEEIR
jgi:hypothetical protein